MYKKINKFFPKKYFSRLLIIRWNQNLIVALSPFIKFICSLVHIILVLFFIGNLLLHFFLGNNFLFVNPGVHMFDKSIYFLKVIFCMFFDIIVACCFHEIWWEIFVYAVFKHTVSVANMYKFISHPMYDENGIVDIFYPFYIWKFITGKCPS